MTTLTDSVRIEAPQRSPVSPASPLDPSWDTAPEIRSSGSRFDDETRSGSTRWDRLAWGRGQLPWEAAA